MLLGLASRMEAMRSDSERIAPGFDELTGGTVGHLDDQREGSEPWTQKHTSSK